MLNEQQVARSKIYRPWNGRRRARRRSNSSVLFVDDAWTLRYLRALANLAADCMVVARELNPNDHVGVSWSDALFDEV